MRQLCLFYKIFCIKVPKYIHSHITSIRTSARQPNEFDSFSCRCEYFQNSFLPNVIMECSKLDLNKLFCLSWSSFCKAQLNIIRPSENKIFNIYDKVDIKFFTGMISATCASTNCDIIMTTLQFIVLLQYWGWNNAALFLRCQFFNDIWGFLMNDLKNIDKYLQSLSQDKLISVLLYGSHAFENKTNRKILNFIVQFIKYFTIAFYKFFLLC